MCIEERLAIIDEDYLVCPRCRSSGDDSYLHSTGVIVYDREEDDETTNVTVVDLEHSGSSTELLSSKTCGNPSERRHGVVVEFKCEHCGDGLRFNLAQHKGRTTVGWTIRPSALAPSWRHSKSEKVEEFPALKEVGT